VRLALNGADSVSPQTSSRLAGSSNLSDGPNAPFCSVCADSEKAQVRAMMETDLQDMRHYLETHSFQNEVAWLASDSVGR